MENLELELRVKNRQESIRAERENDRLVSRHPRVWKLRILLADTLFGLVKKLDSTRARQVKELLSQGVPCRD